MKHPVPSPYSAADTVRRAGVKIKINKSNIRPIPAGRPY